MLGTIEFVDKSVNDNSVRRLYHCDVIASHSEVRCITGVAHGEAQLQTELKSFTAAHLVSNTNQQTDWTVGGTCIKSCSSVYAHHLVQSVWLHLSKDRGGDNAHWISMNKMAATAVQWEICGTNFRVNIANLWVSWYNWNNDRSARVLFVQHPREQGEWLRDCIIRPAPSGAGRTTPSQPGHYPLTNKFQWFFLSKMELFHSTKCVWKCRLRIGVHFDQGKMSYIKYFLGTRKCTATRYDIWSLPNHNKQQREPCV